MIYIKDYRSLNSLVFQNRQSGLQSVLESLTGRAVTVFADNACCGFTGILLQVLPDSIKIIARPSGAPKSPFPNCVNGSCCERAHKSTFGTVTVTMIKNITAVAYHEL